MKEKLSAGVCVRLPQTDGGEPRYGCLGRYERKTGLWNITEYETGEKLKMPEDGLVLMPAYNITPGIAKKLVRYDMTCADYAAVVVPAGNRVCSEAYCPTLADMEALLKNLQKKNPTADELSDWAELIIDELEDVFAVGEGAEYCEESFLSLPLPKNDAAMAECVFAAIGEFITVNPPKDGIFLVDTKRILADIKNYRAGKEICRSLWTRTDKLAALKLVEDDSALGSMSEEEIDCLRGIVTELADAGEKHGIERLAYACYGGGRLFACDWVRSRDCLLRLMDHDKASDRDKGFYANTLGYIYYYGRCTDGVPEYDKAFEYFSLGAACGVYESIYKLSDLYLHGRGVRRNTTAAKTLLRMVFDQNYDRIRDGEFDCQFADVALRLGNLCRDGIITDESDISYYQMADYAIKKRMAFNQYGDSSVANAIAAELARARESEPVQKRVPLHGFDAVEIIYRLFDDYACRVELHPLKSGVKITVRRIPHPRREEARGELDLLTEFDYCELVTSATFTAEGAKVEGLEKKETFTADCFEFTEIEGKSFCIFLRYNEPVFGLAADCFTRRIPAAPRRAHRKYRFASVTFSPGGKSYDYICDLDGVEAGDIVVVPARDGEQVVEVVRVFDADSADMPLEISHYKKILRKV